MQTVHSVCHNFGQFVCSGEKHRFAPRLSKAQLLNPSTETTRSCRAKSTVHELQLNQSERNLVSTRRLEARASESTRVPFVPC